MRTGDIVLTKILYPSNETNPDQKEIGYEVFVVKKQQEGTISWGGVETKIEAKELTPSNEEFGRLGFYYCIGGYEKALAKFELMVKQSSEGIDLIPTDDLEIELIEL